MNDTLLLDFVERWNLELVPRRGLWNVMIADSPNSQVGLCAHADLRTAIETALKDQKIKERIFEISEGK